LGDKLKENLRTTKLTNEGLNFLKKMQVNRIKKGVTEEMETIPQMMDLVVKFFKLNNDIYLTMLEVDNA
jgi:hypothetical protein